MVGLWVIRNNRKTLIIKVIVQYLLSAVSRRITKQQNHTKYFFSNSSSVMSLLTKCSPCSKVVKIQNWQKDCNGQEVISLAEYILSINKNFHDNFGKGPPKSFNIVSSTDQKLAESELSVIYKSAFDWWRALLVLLVHVLFEVSFEKGLSSFLIMLLISVKIKPLFRLSNPFLSQKIKLEISYFEKL